MTVISAVHLDPTSPFGMLLLDLELDCCSEHLMGSFSFAGQGWSCSVSGCPTPETEISLKQWNFVFAIPAAWFGIASV